MSLHTLPPFIYIDPFLDPTVGNNIEISEAPSPEDFYYLTTTTSYLAIHLTATDSSGLSSTAILEIQPRLVNLIFDTVPSGIPILINQDKYETPASLIGWENDKFEIEAPTRLNRDNTEKLVFASWSDGMTEHVRDFVVPALTDPDPVVATFEQEEEEEAIYEPEMESEDGGEAEEPELVPIDEVKDEDDKLKDDTAPAPAKKSTKFVVGLLDMSVSVRFGNEVQRRRRMSESVDLVSLLEKELKDVVSDALSSAMASAVNMPGSRTAPLHGIRFARMGERASVGKDGLTYSTTFGGLAIFDREDEGQEVPTEFMIQSLQLQALSQVEDELLSDLREYVAEAGDVMGYSHVRSISADVIAKPDTDSTTKASGGETDPVYVGLLVIAILLCVLVLIGAIAVFGVRRRSRKESSAAFCVKAMADDISKENDDKKGTNEVRGSGSDTDDESPMNSPAKEYPYDRPSNREGDPPMMMMQDDENLSVSSSAASSASGSVRDIARNLMHSLSPVLQDDDDDASVASSVKNVAKNIVHSLSAVLGPDDREEVHEEDEASLVPVVGHDKGRLSNLEDGSMDVQSPVEDTRPID